MKVEKLNNANEDNRFETEMVVFFCTQKLKGEEEMYTEKFLQQVHRKLIEAGITNAKLRDTCIEIFEGENEIFKIDRNGGMFYSASKQFKEVVDKLHDKIQPIVCEVDEYLKAMENSTELKAIDFNMPYRKLAEFNEVVFAGIEHDDGRFEFATWDYRKNALYHGHYNPDYRTAKEDFATRSGLVNAKLIFKNTELVEIYRCLEDTLNNGYELAGEQRKMLEDMQDRIQYSVVGFEELLKESMDKSPEETFEQSM